MDIKFDIDGVVCQLVTLYQTDQIGYSTNFSIELVTYKL